MIEKEKAQPKPYLRGWYHKLDIPQTRITVVRDAVELVPPTALLLYSQKRIL